jgi:ribosomal protein L11 methyltransferase
VDYELIIEPKMSFGTAHHPTTYMMLSYVAELEMQGRRVLDMGCGTAVLGILAKMRGAEYVEGVDIDEWAFNNARENAVSNGVEIVLKLGDASSLQGHFDVVIANINRNILLNDMGRYAAVLNAGGTLLLSGFYEADEAALVARAGELGMTLKGKKNRDGWSALQLRVKS